MDLVAEQRDGLWSWRHRRGDVEIRFAGKGPPEREAVLRRVLPEGVEAAWLEQVHSADVVDARPGCNGPGDALVTAQRHRALAVVTADCVPLLLADGRRIAAVHAGWRGIAKSIVTAALRHFDADGGPLAAWIGPAIGPCCYEVGDDVAEEVVAATRADVARPGGRGLHRYRVWC